MFVLRVFCVFKQLFITHCVCIMLFNFWAWILVGDLVLVWMYFIYEVLCCFVYEC
jgi:hypothetical protein